MKRLQNHIIDLTNAVHSLLQRRQFINILNGNTHRYIKQAIICYLSENSFADTIQVGTVPIHTLQYYAMEYSAPCVDLLALVVCGGERAI